MLVLAGAGAKLSQLDQAERSLFDIAMIQGHRQLLEWFADQAETD